LSGASSRTSGLANLSVYVWFLLVLARGLFEDLGAELAGDTGVDGLLGTGSDA
jgi:hypothetical protein